MDPNSVSSGSAGGIAALIAIVIVFLVILFCWWKFCDGCQCKCKAKARSARRESSTPRVTAAQSTARKPDSAMHGRGIDAKARIAFHMKNLRQH